MRIVLDFKIYKNITVSVMYKLCITSLSIVVKLKRMSFLSYV